MRESSTKYNKELSTDGITLNFYGNQGFNEPF